MAITTGIAAPWVAKALWAAPRPTPAILVLAGIGPSEIVEAALADSSLTAAAVVRFEPDCTAPCDATLWRLETAAGESLNRAGLLRRHWHRRPFALTVRLVRYQPGSTTPEVLDEGTLGTRGPYAAFRSAVERLAMRFVRDAALGQARGPADMPAAEPASGRPGWLDALAARWHDRAMTEWWSIGTTTASMADVLTAGKLGSVTWYRVKAGHRYLADPFPWFGTGKVLCEEMPLTGGVGRIVALPLEDGGLGMPSVLLDDGVHHSYPCTIRADDAIYCVPETTQRGATIIHRLEADGCLTPVHAVAPHARLADPTLFRRDGLYWLACTDLDLGDHDNLCLLYASNIAGPWTAHRLWPVKTDIRGARSAGMLFDWAGRLFRPGQDCRATYGGAVRLHEIVTLTETEFREVPAAILRPDPLGPFPHGLHTLVHDGDRFWIDGKRFVFDPGLFVRKIAGKASSLAAKTWVG